MMFGKRNSVLRRSSLASVRFGGTSDPSEGGKLDPPPERPARQGARYTPASRALLHAPGRALGRTELAVAEQLVVVELDVVVTELELHRARADRGLAPR